MDITTILSKDNPIKTRSAVNVLAISSDDVVQLTKLKPARKLLVASSDENKNDDAWGIDDIKPFKRLNGTTVMCQMILADACVPQRTSFEEPYKNPEIGRIRDDAYQKTKSSMEKEKQKQLALRYMQIGIGAILAIFLLGMLFG